jgi:hypothetical protein
LTKTPGKVQCRGLWYQFGLRTGNISELESAGIYTGMFDLTNFGQVLVAI